MEKEPVIIVNGHQLNTAQIMTFRGALNNFKLDLKANILEDSVATEGYLTEIREMYKMLHISKEDKIKAHKQISTLPRIVTENLDPDKVISQAYGEMSEVLLIGRDHEEKYYFASSVADGGDILWLVEKLRCRLMDEIE